MSDITSVAAEAGINEYSLIFSVFIVLLCAILVLLVGQKFRMPVIIGYFLTGIIVGPSCLHLVSQTHVDLLSEFGVILLMFTIGMEISLKNLLSMKKIVLVGGCIQLFLTTFVVWGILMLCGFTFGTSLFIGFLVAHSSTAIIMSIYQKSGEVDKYHGKISLGLLIFQDLNVVPMMMLIPFFAANDKGNATTDILGDILNFLFGMGIMAIILIAAIWLIPKLLKHIALKRNSELFVIAIVVICFGIAWLMNLNGVSLALGAFLAGIAISQSDYSHEVIGQIAPIKDILVSFFFVSIGMMLNLQLLWENIVIILLFALALMVLKFGVNFISVKALGISTGICIVSAVGLSQIGEFSFILGKECVNNGIISSDVYQIFLAISIITMAVTPFLAKAVPKFVDKHFKPKVVKPQENVINPQENHEIIVGFGLTGQYVAKALKKLDIPYIILEMNAKTVEEEKKKGENIIYGDAARDSILEFAKIDTAKSIVITIPIMDSVKAIITTARRMNPHINIITRSRFIAETQDLYKLGADEVIVDERESAIQIFKRILASKNLPVQDIDTMSKEMRCHLYDQYIDTPSPFVHTGESPTFFETIKLGARKADGLISREMSQVEQMRVEPGCSISGKKLSEIHLRAQYGISVLAVRHEGTNDAAVSPDGETCLNEGDIVVMMGQQKSLNRVLPLFSNQEGK